MTTTTTTTSLIRRGHGAQEAIVHWQSKCVSTSRYAVVAEWVHTHLAHLKRNSDRRRKSTAPPAAGPFRIYTAESDDEDNNSDNAESGGVEAAAGGGKAGQSNEHPQGLQ